MNKITSRTRAIKRATVSIVIPVYNEEAHIAACLDAIAAQTVQPLEVVVVDNNSTDQTAAIAARYPFVRIVRESRQGLVHTRTCGFDAARGEIIGRIDTDSHLPADWVARVQHIFKYDDVDAVSGSAGFYDMAYSRQVGAVFDFFRGIMAKLLARRAELFLYGSNMAIRKKAWQQVRNSLCVDFSLHEDMDIAAHFAHSSARLVYDKNLRVTISARRADSSTRSFYFYVVANRRTYAAHGLRGRFYMVPLECLAMSVHLLLKLLYRGYDKKTGTFTWHQVFRPSNDRRVSPVSETSA